MRKFLNVAVVLALLLPASAIATTESFSYQEGSASAAFLQVDPAGCITTNIDVSVFERRTSEDPGSTESPWINVYIYRFDQCHSVALLEAQGRSDTASVQVNRSLQSATAQGSVEMQDLVQGGSFHVDVAMTWTSTGALVSNKDHFVSYYPGSRYIVTRTGRSREAQANGSVAVEGTNWLTGASEWAEIASGQGRTTLITRVSR